jgi:hypothetical protein
MWTCGGVCVENECVCGRGERCVSFVVQVLCSSSRMRRRMIQSKRGDLDYYLKYFEVIFICLLKGNLRVLKGNFRLIKANFRLGTLVL